VRTLPPQAFEALERLLAGNARTRSGLPLPFPGQSHRDELANGQHPFAAVLSCIDSRVAPEVVFHQEPGNLIVARVLSNVADDAAVATMEFAVAELHVPLVFVLGHSQCAAIQAAIAMLSEHARTAKSLEPTLRVVTPAVRRAKRSAGDWLDNAVAENVRLTVDALAKRSSVLRAALKENAAGLAGGVYDIRSATVTRLL
jgi:carbonic anhydrase